METPWHVRISMNKILAIDQGTTSTKALVIDEDGQILGSSGPATFNVESSYPRSGWVQCDPFQLLESVLQSAQAALSNAKLKASDIAAIGLANQGETVIAFDAHTGIPVCPAISWQDRRAQSFTDQWRTAGLEEQVFGTTGLRLDAYFSAPKLAWILTYIPQARELRTAGRLCYGTSDAWLMWQLTGGRQFVTDVATASRTMLLDLATLEWSPQLSELFGIPIIDLPMIVANSEPIGVTSRQLMNAEIPITGICVDQQSALFGHRAFKPGDGKITYGTGCFVLTNIGANSSHRAPGLLTSVGWQNAETTKFVFDGGVYSAGSLINWLCSLGIATNVAEISKLAENAGHLSQVMLIPAFGGLSAPRWSSRARACWVGMDHSTDRRHLVRSALDAIAFSVKEIVDAMDEGTKVERLDVDGGLCQCDLLMQIQADLLGVRLTRSSLTEFTALGVGYFAGLGCGLWKSPQQLPRPEAAETTFEPRPGASQHYSAMFIKWKEICTRVVAMGDAGLFQSNVEGGGAIDS
jgi:glycerol kinase